MIAPVSPPIIFALVHWFILIIYYISKPTSTITCSNNISDKCIDIIFYCCFASVWINTITFFYTHSNMFWLVDRYAMVLHAWFNVFALSAIFQTFKIINFKARCSDIKLCIPGHYTLWNWKLCFFEQLWQYLLFKNNSTIGRLRRRTSLVGP